MTHARETVASAEEYLRGFDRLVVVAPHPDDDVLGCGGTLAAAAATGLDAVVVYVTDGSASHVGSESYPPARLRDVREREARAALLALGVGSEPRFLRIADGTVAGLDADENDAIVAAIADAADATVKALVLGPWLRDHHADHVAVAALVRRACAHRPKTTLLEYAIWLDELGSEADRPRGGEAVEITLDAGAHAGAKAAALAEHRSQLGALITDAGSAFVLPPRLIASAGHRYERFLRIL
jgi:LmbE family N-acetylglucosaminyl deacetylase